MANQARHYGGIADLGGTVSGTGNRTNVVAIAELLERARADDIFIPALDLKPVPENKAETASWRRMVNDAVVTTTITEGVNPDWQAVTYEDVTGTFEERVEIYAVTSRARRLSEDDHVANSVEQLKDKVLRIRNAVGWSKWLAASTVLRNDPAHAAIDDVDGPISLGIIQEGIRLLDDAKAMHFTEVDDGGMFNGTVPIEPSFISFGHTNMLPDLRRVDGFVTPAEYGSAKAISKHEKGNVENTRWLLSPELTPIINAGAAVGTTNMKSTGGTNIDVYPVLIVGMGALGAADLKGDNDDGWGNVSVQILDDADKADPANLNVLAVAHWWDLQLILNDTWVVRLEVGVTDDLTA